MSQLLLSPVNMGITIFFFEIISEFFNLVEHSELDRQTNSTKQSIYMIFVGYLIFHSQKENNFSIEMKKGL